MKKLVIVLIIAAAIVGGIIYGESKNVNSGNPQITSNNTIISATKNATLQSISDNEILEVANSSSNYNFNTVLNREPSGNFITAEMKNSKDSNIYVGNFSIVNNSLVIEGKIKPINSEVNQALLSNSEKDSKSKDLGKQNINTVASINSEKNSNSKSNDYIEATIENTKVKDNDVDVKSGKEAMKLALQWYDRIYKGVNTKNLQSTVLANQSIDGESGYLVQLYDFENNDNSTSAVLLITKNGEIYNANTDPLKKIN